MFCSAPCCLICMLLSSMLLRPRCHTKDLGASFGELLLRRFHAGSTAQHPDMSSVRTDRVAEQTNDWMVTWSQFYFLFILFFFQGNYWDLWNKRYKTTWNKYSARVNLYYIHMIFWIIDLSLCARECVFESCMCAQAHVCLTSVLACMHYICIMWLWYLPALWVFPNNGETDSLILLVARNWSSWGMDEADNFVSPSNSSPHRARLDLI